MATTYPLTTLAPTVSATGISAPSYNDVYQSLIAIFQSIYGSNIYISGDSQDGQWIAALAKCIYDSNMAAVNVFQSFSPTYAQGVGLSSLVKLNGLARNIASKSTALGLVVGQAGTVVTGGVVEDENGNLWNLPATVTIPISGQISVTVTAQNDGSTVAPAGSINAIYNPQLGWQSFVSTTDATVGSPVESDATLRKRQYASTATPALSMRDSIYSTVANLPGVTSCAVYDNDTGAIDQNGIPAHSIAVVVSGGDANAIAAAIDLKKPTGAQTYGSTTLVVYDRYGLPTKINFFILQPVEVYFTVTIKALTGYVASTGTLIQSALAAFVNTLPTGDDVYASQASAAASLIALGAGQTFYITNFTLGLAPNPVTTGKVGISFNQTARCSSISNITLAVT